MEQRGTKNIKRERQILYVNFMIKISRNVIGSVNDIRISASNR